MTAISDAVLDFVVNDEKALVRKSLLPLAAGIDIRVVGPLVRLMGLRLAGADVYAVNAACANPPLTG